MKRATEARSDDGSPSPVKAVGHIAVTTGDLARFRTFYEGLLRLPHVITLRMARPPFLVHGVFAVGRDTALHAFEVPGYDPAVDGIGTGIGQRGRIDHFALLVDDEAALHRMRDRLVAGGASDGAVVPMGPYLSVRFQDPDGLEGQVSCPNAGFDPMHGDDEVLECTNAPQWTETLLAR